MGRVLCTFPGRYGDLLWALPAIRAIAESGGQPVDLQIAGEFEGIRSLLEGQSYLHTVLADPRWGLTPPNEWRAPDHYHQYDHTYHLGYRGWPTRPLPEEIYLQAVIETGRELPSLDLQRPWLAAPVDGPITYSTRDRVHQIAVGFSECYFELKVGLLQLVSEHDIGWSTRTVMGGGRWMDEAGQGSCNWAEAAHGIASAQIFLGDCSALHVLAVALGIPVVIVEPMEARWNEIFYPYGTEGPQVTLVRGLDGRPTFDARHTIQTIEEVIRARLL